MAQNAGRSVWWGEKRKIARMWKLKLSQGNEAWVTSVNHHIGRQYWEFDPNPGASEEELARIEEARNHFRTNRFHAKHSSDLLMRLQVRSHCSSCNPHKSWWWLWHILEESIIDSWTVPKMPSPKATAVRINGQEKTPLGHQDYIVHVIS